jgi:hypothetical protein
MVDGFGGEEWSPSRTGCRTIQYMNPPGKDSTN